MSIGYKGQSTFVGGEITPELGENTDLQRYKTSVKTMKNMFSQVYGGASNRQGTEFTGRTPDDTKNYRSIPFSFSTTQTYALIFGHQIMMVVMNGGLVLESSQNITAITKANPGVVTITAHGKNNGDFIYLAGIGGMTQLNGRFVKIKNKTTNTFEITDWDGNNINTTAYGTYTSGGTGSRLYVKTTPYSHLDLELLKFTQSTDTMTITHPSYQEYELTRSGHAAWTFTAVSFLPKIATPSGSSGTHVNAGSETYNYQITAVSSETLEESLPESFTVSGAATLSATNKINITIPTVTGASSYNVYRQSNGVYGFIGSSNVAGSAVFVDNFIDPDLQDSPPTLKDPLNTISNNHAATTVYHQQRRVFGGSNANPQTHYGTQLGNYYNMNISSPSKDSDAYALTLASNKVNRIRHFVSMRDMVVLTSDGAWAVRPGSNSDVINAVAQQVPQNELGVSEVRPLVAIDTILLVESSGAKIYDLGYLFNADQYQGVELSLLANHLFEGYQIKDWCSARRPFSIVWAVRNDGKLLGMTYLKQEGIIGWHQHDTDGNFKSTCSIEENNQDAVYFITERVINGVTRKYIERMRSRFFKPLIEDAFFVDCGLTLDNWNKNTASSMILSGGTNWTTSENLTLTENGGLSPFSSADVGKTFTIRIFNTDGTIKKRVRLLVTNYTSPTVVTVNARTIVPTELRSVSTTNWARMVESLSGLDHLEGKSVAILADGNVHPQQIVTNGSIDLQRPYAKIHVGLPYQSLIELLDIDIAELGQSTFHKPKSVGEIDISYVNSRGGFVAASVDDKFYELIQRNVSDADNPIPLQTGRQSITIPPRTEKTGHLAFKQDDPLPITITSMRPKINFPKNDT